MIIDFGQVDTTMDMVGLKGILQEWTIIIMMTTMDTTYMISIRTMNIRFISESRYQLSAFYLHTF